MDNEAFFKLYGFNYVPERQIKELARLHLSNRQGIQAAKLSESMVNNIKPVDTIVLHDSMVKDMIKTLKEKEINTINTFRKSDK